MTGTGSECEKEHATDLEEEKEDEEEAGYTIFP
jgi:hypothetical protein